MRALVVVAFLTAAACNGNLYTGAAEQRDEARRAQLQQQAVADAAASSYCLGAPGTFDPNWCAAHDRERFQRAQQEQWAIENAQRKQLLDATEKERRYQNAMDIMRASQAPFAVQPVPAPRQVNCMPMGGGSFSCF